MKTFRRVNKALLSQAEIWGITMLLFRFAALFFTHIIQLSESISVGVFSFFFFFSAQIGFIRNVNCHLQPPKIRQ